MKQFCTVVRTANIPAALAGLAFVRSPRHMLTQTIQRRYRVSTQTPCSIKLLRAGRNVLAFTKRGDGNAHTHAARREDVQPNLPGGGVLQRGDRRPSLRVMARPPHSDMLFRRNRFQSAETRQRDAVNWRGSCALSLPPPHPTHPPRRLDGPPPGGGQLWTGYIST